MPTLEQIKSQIQGLDGMSAFLAKREIKELPNILQENENVEKLIQGFYKDGTGVLVATTDRLIFINKGLLWGLTVENFDYSKISSTQYQTGLLFGEITIYTSNNKAVITQIDKQQTRLFGEWLKNRLTAKNLDSNAQKVDIVNSPASDDTISRLERLAKLREQGILTEEEFLQQKQKILFN